MTAIVGKLSIQLLHVPLSCSYSLSNILLIIQLFLVKSKGWQNYNLITNPSGLSGVFIKVYAI